MPFSSRLARARPSIRARFRFSEKLGQCFLESALVRCVLYGRVQRVRCCFGGKQFFLGGALIMSVKTVAQQ